MAQSSNKDNTTLLPQQPEPGLGRQNVTTAVASRHSGGLNPMATAANRLPGPQIGGRGCNTAATATATIS